MFVPISLSRSPVEPTSQFIIVLRTSDNVQSYPLEGWFTTNITELCKKFVTKTIKIDTTWKPENYAAKLTQQLKLFHASENLNVIGGFQDTKNDLHLLFFKTDKKPAEPLSLFIESYQSELTPDTEKERSDVEYLIN